MNITLTTLVLILVGAVAVYIIFDFIPRLVHALMNYIARRSLTYGKKKNSLTEAFLEADQPGKFFVGLLGAGILCSIKTINHGSDFPDDKQAGTFAKYRNGEIKDALDRIGEGI